MKNLSLLLAALLIMLSASCSRAPSATTIRVGLPGQPAHGRAAPTGLFRIAEEKGFLKDEFGKEPVKLAYVHIAGNGVALNEALASHQLDLATYGGLPNVIGLAGGNPAKMVFVTRSAGEFFLGVKPGSDIHGPQDLKGKKLTVQKGNISHHLLVLWLRAHGLKDSDVTLVSLAIPDGLAAFAAGQVDAVWGTQTILQMRDKGLLRIVGSTHDGKGDYSDIALAGTGVSDEFERDHPDLVRRLIKVMVRSAWWASQPQNRTEVLRMEADSAGFPYAYMEQTYPGPQKARFDPVIDDHVVRGFGQIVDFAYQQKLIRSKPSLAGWLEPKYEDQALKDLHLEHYWDSAEGAGAPTGVQ
jgi:sulfonate transport system substrate-binding protein